MTGTGARAFWLETTELCIHHHLRENHCQPYKSHKSNSHMVTERNPPQKKKNTRETGSRLNELGISGLNEAATTT